MFLQLLRLLTDETRHCQWVFSLMNSICDRQKLHLVNMKILPSLNVINSIFFQKRNAFVSFLSSTTSFAKISYPDDWVVTCEGNMGKVAEVLVTLASHCDFCFKGSSTSFSENKLIVGLNSNFCDCSIKKKQKKSSLVFGRLIWWNFSSMKESCR